ncbi:MAG: DUF4124 domain-containing protein [Gammaproteobacteria bacterium]|nr:DUF4124 domain-containing protein [Gammaproteobacteria bacterium]
MIQLRTDCSWYRWPSAAALLGSIALCLAMLGAAPAEANGRIYKTVDEDGNVVFTDVPPRPEQRGETVDLNSGNSFTPPERENDGISLEAWRGDEPAGPEDEEETVTRYNSLQVASPQNDAAVRDNAGNVSITATVDPDLQPGHTLQLFLDGELQQSGGTTTFQLSNVDRGTHEVQLRIVGPGGEILMTSPGSVFHLQRRSVILQPGGARGN